MASNIQGDRNSQAKAAGEIGAAGILTGVPSVISGHVNGITGVLIVQDGDMALIIV